MTLAVAAAAASVGASSASASAAPWSASLGSMVRTGYDTATGTNVFDMAPGFQPGGGTTTREAAPAGGHDSAEPAPAVSAASGGGEQSPAGVAGTQPASAQAADQQTAPKSQLPILQALQPLKSLVGQHPAPAPSHAAPSHPSAPQHPAAPQRPAESRKTAPAKAVPSRPAPSHGSSHHSAPAPKPYTIYDSVNPGSIPSGQQVAVYSNGNYKASASDVRGRHNVLWIDINGSDPGASVLDVEPGDATPSGAAQWVKTRLTAQPNGVAIVYTMLSEWQQVKDAIGGLPGHMQSRVRYWIADPTGVPHVVPGSSATQWYWGSHYDITTALPEFSH